MTREHAGLDTLDWNRLRSGDRRALNPENQPLFDQFYALNREPDGHSEAAQDRAAAGLGDGQRPAEEK